MYIKNNLDRKIITLCGSTKFESLFQEVNKQLTLAGLIVLSVGSFNNLESEKISEADFPMIDKLHLDKIKIGDMVYVINPGGYIGGNTFNEISLARMERKQIFFLDRVSPLVTDEGYSLPSVLKDEIEKYIRSRDNIELPFGKSQHRYSLDALSELVIAKRKSQEQYSHELFTGDSIV